MPIEITLVANESEQNQVGHPATMVTIVEGTPYTVPAGKIFVLTAIGTVSISTAVAHPVEFIVDDVVECWGGIVGPGSTTVLAGDIFYPGISGMAEVPEGLAFPAGSVITLDDGTLANNGRAFGYLSED